MMLEKLGPFKIGRVLGRGGMGAVYEGIHEDDNSAVAIKVLSDSFDEDAEVRVRFETEIETLKRLYHPNIVRLSGFGADHGQLYYVMEFVDGPSLQQELRRRRLFQWHEVAKIGLEICQALRHAHDRGIIHRDIKPANILLDQGGNIKLSDFGIARFFGSQSITDIHSVIGTLEYMSPEQALANPISSSTDLYSLGCVLYALLVGKPPFPARSLPELLRKHQTIIPALIGSVRHDVPDELGYIIVDLLKIRPEDRPRNAFLVTKRLQSLLQSLVGDPAEIKVLPLLPETPKRYHESVFPLCQLAETYEGGSIIELDRIVKPEAPDRRALFPQGETLTGSFKRIGEEHSVTVFPANHDFDESENSGNVSSKTDTVTSLSAADDRRAIPILNGGTAGQSVKFDVAPLPHEQATPQDVQQGSETPVKPLKTPTRFTTVADKKFDPFEEEDRAARPILSLPIVLTSTLLMFIGLTVYYLIQPVPPDVLYVRITTTLREGETANGYSPARLRSAQKDIDQFLAMYPDHPLAAQVAVFQDELHLSDHERRLERRMQFSSLRPLSPVERTYVNILTSLPNDPEQMIDKLRAFIAVFQTVRPEGSAVPQRHASSPVEICVELARRRLQKLEQDVAEINAEQEQVIRRRLDEAADWDSTDPTRAEGIRRGIIELYQNHRWADGLVEEAKQFLSLPTATHHE